MIYLQKYGISTTLAARIYQHYGQSVYRVIEENPYQMADHVPGVGFKTADEIASKVGIHTDSDYRIRSGIFYTLIQSVSEGHVYLLQEVLLYRASQLLDVEVQHIEKYVMDLAMEKKVVLKESDEGLRVYSAHYYYMELTVAKMLHDLNVDFDVTPSVLEHRIHMIEEQAELALDDRQREAVMEAVRHGILIVTGGPGTGKTTLLKDAAKSILRNNPEMYLIILLIDERPEEVTDIKEAIQGSNVEVIYSTFDEQPEHHKRVSEMVIERAKRLVESKKDVTIFIDSITRLARAYNLTVPPSGRTLSGGLDPAALYMPKRFFGAARNMREGGSLTILATALVDTGSKMDDVVYEEFKGTGNMELVLDRKLQERRVFPAIDIAKSGTRREDLLLTPDEQEAVYNMRKALNGMKSEEAVENILNMFARTRNNGELIQILKKQKIV